MLSSVANRLPVSSSRKAPELFQTMFATRTPEELASIAATKRFIELFIADATLREALLSGASDEVACAIRPLPVSPAAIRPVWDLEFASSAEPGEWPEVRRWQDWFAELKAVSATLAGNADTGGISPAFDAWHRRQLARTTSELGSNLGLTLQPVIAFELSHGCSVGCWFCGVSAEKFGGYLAYTPENASFWRTSLESLQRVLGRGMQTAICYWATDPMDNPDYVRFISDYHEITGYLPPMTTAIPLRNVRLTREVLRLAEEREGVRNRFSVLTVRMLEQIHAEFTPLEMLRAELLMQMKGSLIPITISGKALEREKGKAAQTAGAAGTIACVSGFLVNMLDRTVRLITPCHATAENPRGYYVLAEAEFTCAEELAARVSAMIAGHMPERVSETGVLRFRPDLRFETDARGFQLTTRAVSHSVRGDAYARRLGEMVREGVYTAREISDAVVTEGGDMPTVRGLLKRLFDQGFFDLVPAAAAVV